MDYRMCKRKTKRDLSDCEREIRKFFTNGLSNVASSGLLLFLSRVCI